MSSHGLIHPADVKPKGPTYSVADLAWLVVGVAVMLALFRSSGWSIDLRTTSTRPTWLVGLEVIRIGLFQGCVAIGPAVIARRARLGGRFHPAEFIALFLGLNILIRMLALVWFRNTGPRPAVPSLLGRLGLDGYGAFMLAHMGIGLCAGVGLLAGRRRFSGWVTGLLLLLFLSGFEGPYQFFFEIAWNRVPFLVPLDSRSESPVLPTFVLAPFRIINGIPCVFAIITMARRSRERMGWVEWSCGVLGLATIVVNVAFNLGARAARGVPWTWTRGFIEASFFINLALAAVLIRLFEAAGRRWLFGDDRRALASPDDPAMMGSSLRE